jgi:hypothetical protein
MNAQEIYQKRIVEAAENHEQCYNVGEEHGYLYTHKGDIKEAVIYGADFALQNQWISVSEALPTERDKEDEQYSTNVFVRTKDCIHYAYYDFYNESWCSVEGGYRFGGDVTHWMPIPSLEGGEK